MSYGFGLTIELLVAILLLLTILYCARLNRQIEKLKADEKLMKASVAELVLATERAERAIAGLKLTANEAQDTLGVRLREAEACSHAMMSSLQSGEDLLGRLRMIAAVNRPGGADAPSEPKAVPETPAADAKALAAAAQAFADRARARANGLAA